MTVRQGAGAWVIALCLLMLGQWFLFRSEPAEHQLFEDAEIAVIGSSLLAYAVPETGSGESALFAGGQTHKRIAISLISEGRAIRLGENALAGGARDLLIEVDPFIKGFRDRSPATECDGWSEQGRAIAWRSKRRSGDAFRRFIGRQSNGNGLGEPSDIQDSQMIDEERLAAIYPLRLHQPRCRQRLEALIQRASAQGAKLTLVLPPRSQAARQLIGPAQSDELRQLAEQLADQLGVSLFAPKGPWPNEQFTDHAHLNVKGRAHFLRALKQWRASGS